MDNVKIKPMATFGSKRWGIYINDRLVEGGFFSRAYAEEVADDYRRIYDVPGEAAIPEDTAADIKAGFRKEKGD